jgi:hypothetical protein
MTDLVVTAKNISSDWNRGSIVEDYVANVALVVGQVVYIDSNNKANLADANVVALNARAVGIVTGSGNEYGETTIPAGQYAQVTIAGPVYGFSGLGSGQFFWVSKVAGNIDDAAPTGGAYQYVLGHAINSDTIFLAPGQAIPASV